MFRRIAEGVAAGDVIARAGERIAGVPLLPPVMRDGRRLAPRPALAGIRAGAAARLAEPAARLRARVLAAARRHACAD